MQFYTGDWLKDPALTVCPPSARGVWIDLLCAMHESGRSGELRGSREQLAQIARCQTAELTQALTDLQTTGAACVTERNGLVTVMCRRMNREHKSRETNALRQQRFRMSRASNGVDPEVRSRSRIKAERESSARPSLSQVKTRCQFAGYPEAEGEAFWHHFESSGWIDKNGHPIRSWESKLATWATNARGKASEAEHHEREGNRAVSASVAMVRDGKELDRIEKRIAALKSGYSDHQSWSASDLAEFLKLRDRRKELKGKLGMAV